MSEVFEEGKEYKRSDIHNLYKGSRQSGISVSAEFPFIFIFSSKSGKQYGYNDGWINDEKIVFRYTGAGQVGNMEMKRGNLALANHLSKSKRVFLFEESRRSHFKFVNELSLKTYEKEDITDKNGNIREGIIFFFGITDDSEKGSSRLIAEEPKRPQYGRRKELTETEKSNWRTSRVGQGAFRRSLLYRWKEKCVVTGCDDPSLLIASHIVSWKESEDLERVDVNNGLLLSPTYDALFDKHLIGFDDDGKIIISDQLTVQNRLLLGVSGEESISGLNGRNIEYLKRYRMLMP